MATGGIYFDKSTTGLEEQQKPEALLEVGIHSGLKDNHILVGRGRSSYVGTHPETEHSGGCFFLYPLALKEDPRLKPLGTSMVYSAPEDWQNLETSNSNDINETPYTMEDVD